MTIEIVNKRHQPHAPGIVTVYVGRPSVLGNPYTIGRDGTRDEVVSKYRSWLWNHFRSNQAVRDEIHRLIDLYQNHDWLGLECWCAPEACHADQIKRLMTWLMDNQEKSHVAD